MEHTADVEALTSEQTPLIEKPCARRASYVLNPNTGEVQTTSENDDLAEHGIKDAMTYNVAPLSTWETFAIRHTTVWWNPRLWQMMLRLTAVAVTVSVLTVLLVPNPAAMKVSKFTEVSKFLNVVVGLLLGFFMSSSMSRWHSCVNGFLQLLDAVRSLQMQFIALGVPDKETGLTLRYGMASAWLLYGQLSSEAKAMKERDGTEREAMWKELGTKPARVDRSGHSMMVESREAEILKITRDPPVMMWTWIAAFIGRLSQDGWIPPMPTPTYGRILNLCNSAFEGIRQVRASISIQAPLSYTHMLAALVHINNLLNALTFGIVSGLAIGTALVARGFHFHKSHAATEMESIQDTQSMVVTFMYCFFGPMIYQALLLISLDLAQPFASESAKIPLDRLMHQLEIDLCNGRDIVDHMEFEKPFFKAPPAKPAEV